MDLEQTPPPKVSIVIPTYNTGRYLLEAIDSVLAQSYGNLELVVVDDGSSDDTPALLAQAPGNFIRIRQDNAGQSAALNHGWARCSGDILGYLSADDRLHPTAVQEIVDALAQHPEACLAYPDFRIMDAQSNPLRTITTPDYAERRLVADFHCLPGPGALFRRSAWERTRGWDVGLRNIPDMAFFLYLCQHAPFVRVPRALADFRIHAGSTTYRACAAPRADEPVAVVRQVFGDPALPERFGAYRRGATANALLLSGFMHGFSGRYGLFLLRAVQAGLRSPSLLLSRKMVSYLHAIAQNIRKST